MTATDTRYDDLIEEDVDQDALDEELEALAPDLDEWTQEFIDQLVAKILFFMEKVLLGFQLFPYQRQPAARIVESLLINDGEEITLLQARQSGKTETLADVIAACMILLPRLAKAFPDLLGKYKDGFMVGVFAPVDEQAETIFARVVSRLTSDRATEMMLDPEIDDQALTTGGKMVRLRKSGSFCRMQTAHPRAKVESKTYHFILIDEAQDADDRVVRKSIHPMLAFHNGTICKTGTPTTHKGDFYRAIQNNKRRSTRRGARQNHFEANWRACAKYNKNYGRFIRKEIIRLGEDSDDFRMSYDLAWLLDRGMFAQIGMFNPDAREFLGDKSMQIVQSYYKTPVVVGVDVARDTDSTVVTVCWVNWDWEDEIGLREHRVLNWLELQGEEWEMQYAEIYNFLRGYRVWRMAVDGNGMGGPVAERLGVMMPGMEVITAEMDQGSQSKRWKHLRGLMQRRYLTFPAHAYTRRLRPYRRFAQQMDDLELIYKGPHLLAAAPKEAGAHDDYPDSLALACSLTTEITMPAVEEYESPFMRERGRRRG